MEVMSQPEKDVSRPLVVLVHGIRTGGRWMRRIAPLLEEEGNCKVEPAGFGFFNVLSFLVPGFARRMAIATVRRKLLHAIDCHQGRPLIIVAHSFGTYCVTEILKEYPTIRPVRMLFCGSIVAQNFRWDSLRQMDPSRGMAVVNECGARDIWPPLAHSMTFGYGASGTGGFQIAGITDRYHDRAHSGYFTDKFVRQFWVPFIKDRTVVPSGFERKMPEAPWWISAMGVRPLLPWLAWMLLAVSVSALALVWNSKRNSRGHEDSTGPTPWSIVDPAHPPDSLSELKSIVSGDQWPLEARLDEVLESRRGGYHPQQQFISVISSAMVLKTLTNLTFSLRSNCDSDVLMGVYLLRSKGDRLHTVQQVRFDSVFHFREPSITSTKGDGWHLLALIFPTSSQGERLIDKSTNVLDCLLVQYQ